MSVAEKINSEETKPKKITTDYLLQILSTNLSDIHGVMTLG
jgi:hypothetical protein